MYLEFEPILYGPDRSFASIEFRGKSIICPYHHHPEIELVGIDSGRGRVLIGGYSGTFREDDLFLIGENVPHIFQNSRLVREEFFQTRVIQFRADFAGQGLLQIPEMNPVRQLLGKAAQGLKLTGYARHGIRSLMTDIHAASGPTRVTGLLELLGVLAAEHSLRPLHRGRALPENWTDGRMPEVMAYIQEKLAEKLTVPEAARRAGLTPNAFCRYFKRQTRRTFTEFVNELRVTEACRLLRETKGSVAEVCYASGFSSLAHFHHEFRKRIKRPPRSLRSQKI
jgi:AraC-like DNA-binding protein